MYDLPSIRSGMNIANTGAAVDPNNQVKLFKPLTIKNTTIKNRIFVAPM